MTFSRNLVTVGKSKSLCKVLTKAVNESWSKVRDTTILAIMIPFYHPKAGPTWNNEQKA